MPLRKKSIIWCVALICVFTASVIWHKQEISALTQKESAAAVADGKVLVSNFKFEPQKITVKVGSTVTWENKDGVHTVTSDTNAFSSPTLTGNKSFAHKFIKTGKFPYYCTFHGGKGGSGMAGTVIVVK